VNFDAFTCIIKICYLFKKITLHTCNNMVRTVVFTLQEQDVTMKKAGGNATTHAQHRIIYFCIIYASS